jgi:hypothetical protein
LWRNRDSFKRTNLLSTTYVRFDEFAGAIIMGHTLSSEQIHQPNDEVDAHTAKHAELDQGRVERNTRLTEDAEFPLWNIWTVR